MRGAIGAARAGDAAAARQSVRQIDSIRSALPASRDYDRRGSIAVQLECATALALVAEGKKEEGSGCCVAPPAVRMPSISTR